MDVRKLIRRTERIANELHNLRICDQNVPKAMHLIREGEYYLKLLRQAEKEKREK